MSQHALFGGFEQVTGSRPELAAPFPYAGGKSRVAASIWRALGQPRTYIEPFAGSLAVLLGRPNPSGIEIVNDAEGLVANFWRAVKLDPDAVAEAADWPKFAVDLHARGAALMAARADLVERLEGNPDFYDAKLAGWWAWGVSCSISTFPAPGPWVSVDGRLVKGATGEGVTRQRPHIGGKGIKREKPRLGVSGLVRTSMSAADIRDWMQALADRLATTTVLCGDWSAAVTPVMRTATPTAVFLDPPYGGADRDASLYITDSTTIAAPARQWAINHGEDDGLRIVVAGYDTEEPAMPDSWHVLKWSAGSSSRGSGRNDVNRHRERLWLSPGCDF